MKILLLNEWHNPTIQNLIHYFACNLGPSNFNWTGKRWYRKDFLPLSEMEESSLVPEPEALTALQDGEYDWVIFSDSSVLIYLSSHLPSSRTRRILIDTSDSNLVPKLYHDNCEIYFKSQFTKNALLLGGKNVAVKTMEDQKKMRRFCLSPSTKICQEERFSNFKKNFDVFFNGSAWPRDRSLLLNLIKSDQSISFFGGLYNRPDLPFNSVVSDSLRFKMMNQTENIQAMSSSKICLSMKGNGNNCLRQYEILNLGLFLMVQETQDHFGHVDPEDGKHCVFFKEDGSDLLEKIHHYLDHEDERDEIAKNGKIFFDKHYHPDSMVKYILDVVGEER